MYYEYNKLHMHKNDNCTTCIAHHYTNIHTTICTYIVTVCQNLSFFKVKIFQEVSQLYIPILYNQDWTITCNTWVLFGWHWSQMLLLSSDLTITGLHNISMTLVFLQELLLCQAYYSVIGVSQTGV